MHRRRTLHLNGCSHLGIAITLGIAVSLAITACSHNAGKTLNVYNWASFMDPSVIADFEKETGIKVHYDVYDSDEIMEAKLLAGHSSYDIAVPGEAFFEKDVKAGIFQKLDRSLLPNLKNLDPDAVRTTAVVDPGNLYGVDYTWLASVGIGYDAAKIKARLPNAPVDSWQLIFDPKVVAHFADCGVSVLDSPDDVVGAALAYLGKNPNSESPGDLQLAEQVLAPIRPFLRYLDTAHYFSDLANGDICLALGWSGDIAQARHRAVEAGTGVSIEYFVPKEGTLGIVDILGIPADAPHVANAHLFINYLLRPDVAAKNSMTIGYASGVAEAGKLVSAASRNDTAVYPLPDARARLVPMRAKSQESTRAMMRMWTRIKTGQ